MQWEWRAAAHAAAARPLAVAPPPEASCTECDIDQAVLGDAHLGTARRVLLEEDLCRLLISLKINTNHQVIACNRCS